MKGAPAWLTYLSCAVAILALAVSVATYMRAGPRVRVRLDMSEEWVTGGNPTLTVAIVNNGLAAVDVIGITLGFKFFFSLIYITDISNQFCSRGEDLPYRLEPGSQAKWSFKVLEPIRKGILDIQKLYASRPPDGSDNSEYSAFLLRMIFSMPDGRSRIKLSAPRFHLRIPFLIPIGLSALGPVISVDLGNGVQKTTLPSIRLAHWLNIRSIKMNRAQENKPELPESDRTSPDPENPTS